MSDKDHSIILDIINDETLNEKLNNFNLMIERIGYISIDNHQKSVLNKLLQNHIIPDVSTIVQEFFIPEILWKYKQEGINLDNINSNVIIRMESAINGRLNGIVKGYVDISDSNSNDIEIIDKKEYKISYTAFYVNNKLHRTNGPAIIFGNNAKKYYQNGELHRIDGPAFESFDGRKLYYRKGKQHRDDGPSNQTSTTKKWNVNGKFHKEDGPAITGINQYNYLQYGLFHRIDGPDNDDGNYSLSDNVYRDELSHRNALEEMRNRIFPR